MLDINREFEEQIITPVQRMQAQLVGATPADIKLMHGTTIGAFLIEGGQKAIAFSDSKVSVGNEPVSMTYRKILKIDRYSCLLIAGSPMLGKEYANTLKMWIGYQEDTGDQPLVSRAKTNFLGRLIRGGLGLMHTGIILAPIFVTYDVANKGKARIFVFGPDGSEVEKEDYAASGSGKNVSVELRQAFKKGPGLQMSEAEGIALAQELVGDLAPNIDSFSGGLVHIDVVGPDGVRTIPTEETHGIR